MSFDPYNHFLKIQESIGTPTPKVRAHFGSVWVHSLKLSYTPGSIKCDSRVSLLDHTFASPCLGCEPKAKVATIMWRCILKNIQKCFIKKYFQILFLMSKLFSTTFMQLFNNGDKRSKVFICIFHSLD
jgi:hypothetical protein